MNDLTNATWQGTEIAIVGAAGRLPGARSLEEFWLLLHEGREAIRLLRDDELDAAGVPASVRSAPNFVPRAAVLDDIGWWDARFWGFSPKDASIMDPQHRLFLECAYEALENAGIAPDQAPGRIGVFAGVGMGSWFQQVLLRNRALCDDVGLFLLRHTGNDKDFLSTRVSYELDLHGPSVNVQTACSTSLVAMHMAAQALLAGETDVALAGGVTIELPNTAGYVFKENEILSPDGHCRPFDADSAGTVFGSGAGVVVLRRLPDALAEGDHILGVIRGSAINNDGAGKIGYLAPSVDGQADAIAEAIAIAGVPAETIDYVEAHGTGTRVGDPIEVEALTQAFRRSTDATGFCGLGSVKSNIGHLDTAAGVAGVLKVLLAMQHGTLPSTLHFRTPNPLIDFARTPFRVVADRTAWARRGHPRRAGVSSLGVGGTNAHVVLEEPPVRAPRAELPGWRLLPLSARSASACDTMAINLADHLREHPEVSLADVAHTLQIGRIAHPHRAFVLARDTASAATHLEDTESSWRGQGHASGRRRTLVFQFAGGGAQHPDMARALYRDDALFREVFDEALQSLDRGVADELRHVLLAPTAPADAADVLERPSVGLPALLITQIALARRLMQWGVTPTAMIGHSMGEYAAAHLAGVFSLPDVVRLVALRGRLFEQVRPGGMLSVPVAAAQLAPLLPEGVSIAAVNAPELCVASGPVSGLAQLEQRLTEAELEYRRVRIAVAAHSMLLDPILDEFEQFLRTLTFGAPEIRFVSNRSGDWMSTADATSPRYWVRHLRETVNYAAGLDVILRDPEAIVLEVGPGRSMTHLVQQHPGRGAGHLLLSTQPGTSDPQVSEALPSLLSAVGSLWCHGVEVRWPVQLGEAQGCRVPLPTYPWERQRYWVTADPDQQTATPATPEAEATLATGDPARAPGERATDTRQWFHEPIWERVPFEASAAVSRLWVLGDVLPPAVEAAVALLVAGGTPVVRVRHGEPAPFADLTGMATVSLASTSAGAWEALLAEALRQQAAPSHLLHVWASASGSLDMESAAFDTLAALGQALSRVECGALELRVVTRGAVAVTGGDLDDPMGALAVGPVLGLPAEIEGLRARLVDLDAATALNGSPVLARALAAEVAAVSAATVVAYRHGRRWARSFRAVHATTEVAPLVAREGGCYVITGGLGGIGLTLAKTLATGARVRLSLWSRRVLTDDGTPHLAAREAMQALEALGASVEVRQVDCADPVQVRDAMQAVIAQFGAVHGVIHAAGVLADGLLALKSVADMQAIMAPKLRAVPVLAEAFAAQPEATPRDFFLCCSSVSAMAGLPGQVDYAAANAYLDAWCTREAARVSWPVISLAWSAWRDTGMVARTRGTGPASMPHPLLGRTLRTGSDALFSVVLDPAQHWIMAEHRLANGTSLIPGTGYLEIARAALASWSAGRVLELRDVAFFAPFVLPEDAPRELRVAIDARDDRAQFVIAGRVEPGEDGGQWEEHVMGSARCVPAEDRTPCDPEALRRNGALTPRTVTYDPHLRFGPRWHNVRSLYTGRGQALLELALPSPYVGDLREYLLHPALMDMATAGAQCLIDQFDATQDFFVPLSYGVIRCHAPLTAHLWSHVTLRSDVSADPDLASFDVLVADADGRVLVEISDFLMTRVRDQAQLMAPDATRRRRRRSTLDLDREVAAAPEADEPSWYAEAIAPREGGAAFLHGVSLGTVHPHLLVSPFPLEGLLHRLREVPARRAPREVTPAVAPQVPVDRIEATLAEHPAVAQQAVVPRVDRTGSVRLVAYVQLSAGARATVSELRRALKKTLPPHLVPSMFLLLDAMPVEDNGTVRRDALPDPFGADDDVVPPRTDMERAIAAVWRDVLGVEQISVYDNFFDIGGHSLLAVRAITRLERAVGVRLNQANMVLQTLEQLAAECARRAEGVPA
ncbi:MAG: SDR family NAD(P)-dependent oxidoreductase [Gemmatimonas sp.]|jgi:acyl transferase domain-containing protein|uniref:type I polyketide synthase n=1 Tax=Gemmatimonas sp. TaxID=1962908 RepID=UPI00391893BB